MSEWKETELSKIGNIVSGGTPSTSMSEYWNGEILFVTPFDLSRINSAYIENTERKITEYGLLHSSANLLPVGSIVISSRAPIGYVAIAKKEFTTNQGCKSIVLNENFDAKFFYYCLLQNVERLKKVGGGTTFAEISKGDLEKVKLPHPKEKSEQQQIAKILSTADAVIEKTQAAIAKYKAIKQGMLQDLFTRGIDITTNKLRPRFEDAPQLYRESKLGMIPREWVVKQLGELCSMKSGDGITSEKIYEMGDYPVYGGNGLRGFTSKFTHEGEYTLIGRQGALCGNITRVSGKFYASEHAVTVTPENNVELDWLSQKLFNMNLNQYSEATAQPGLSVFKILPLLAETPTFDEQQRIAERLKSIDHKLQIEQTYLQKKQLIKKGLMEDLLSGKKCLNLDLQDEQMNKIDSGKETVDNPINPKIK